MAFANWESGSRLEEATGPTKVKGSDPEDQNKSLVRQDGTIDNLL